MVVSQVWLQRGSYRVTFIAMKRKRDSASLVKTKGDILQSTTQTLVNTVNCVGVMGKGIALQFKRAYPAMYADYRKRCRQGLVKPGEPYIYKVSESRQIINFPTKDDWKNPSKIEWIEKGLKLLHDNINRWRVESIAIPALGCANGGLNWADVEPMIYKYVNSLPIPVEVYSA